MAKKNDPIDVGSRKPPIATLSILVEFVQLPDRESLEEIIDVGRQYGSVKYAKYCTLNPIDEDLV